MKRLKTTYAYACVGSNGGIYETVSTPHMECVNRLQIYNSEKVAKSWAMRSDEVVRVKITRAR